MAQRRMFSLKVVDTDSFLDMSSSAQLLYFHLAMRADDDGFVSSPKKIARMVSPADDDIKILVAKQFIIPFRSGIIVIRHWKENNYIQSDRKHDTIYKEEMALLSQDSNGIYDMDTKRIQLVSKMDTEDRIGKDRLGEVKSTYTSDFYYFWSIYPKKSEKKKSKEKWDKLPTDVKQLILSDIPKRKLGRKWIEGFIENPMTYLNGDRWEDEIEVDRPKLSTVVSSDSEKYAKLS